MHQIILYTLNLCNVVRQSYINQAGEKVNKMKLLNKLVDAKKDLLISLRWYYHVMRCFSLKS